MPDINDYHAYRSTSGCGDNSSGNGGGGIGCVAWIVIVIAVVVLIFFLADGASWEAIEGLLAFGLIAFLIANSFLFK